MTVEDAYKLASQAVAQYDGCGYDYDSRFETHIPPCDMNDDRACWRQGCAAVDAVIAAGWTDNQGITSHCTQCAAMSEQLAKLRDAAQAATEAHFNQSPTRNGGKITTTMRDLQALLK